MGGNQSDISVLQFLPQLTSLSLSGNQISDINVLQFLPQLTSLSLGGNQINDISALQFLTQLTSLSLVGNQSDISVLQFLPQLTSLNLSGNQISDISVLQFLPELTTLDLSVIQISDISVLQFLPQLTTLDLRYNQIIDISVLQFLTQLTNLDLSGNQFTDLSPLLSFLQRTEKPLQLVLVDFFQFEDGGINLINIINNPITTPPLEIVEQGTEAVLNWFKQREEQGAIKIYEAKMILVGEAGTGKTTLRKKLLDADYPVPNQFDEKNSTHAIEITPQVPFAFEPQPIMANIWDFGGQHNYYSTHRYFLTEWGFYILVVDERKENTRFEYWFQIIDLLTKETSGQQTPVLVLYNKRSGQPMKYIDIDFYRRKFPDLAISTIEIDFAQSDWGNERLRTSIGQNLGKLQHIGTPVPALWLPIRQNLEQIRTQEMANYIERNRFFEICRQHGLQNTEDALYLSRFLHRIGIILHYQEDSDVLARTVILNPDWAIDAIYAALSDREKIKIGRFKFEKTWLIDYWKSKGYDLEEYEVFLNLMFKNRFEIAYSRTDKTGTEWVIVPELLPAIPPHYETEEEKQLVFRYEYEFMPEGLLTHFIVRMNELIAEREDEQIVWKNGVLLTNRQDTFAEVRRLDLEGNRKIKFEIRLWGKHPEDLLKKVREEFETVNNRFSENLKPDELIPCICKECKEGKKPETPKFHILKELINFKEKHISSKQCSLSGEAVPLSGLLKSYDREASRSRWEDEKEIMQKELAHSNREKISLESVLENKGQLLTITILQDIKDNINEFDHQMYYAAAKSLYTNIEHIVNQLLRQINENPDDYTKYRGLASKAIDLKGRGIIADELQKSINTTERNDLLHGSNAPADQTLCKPPAQLCMHILAKLIDKLQ